MDFTSRNRLIIAALIILLSAGTVGFASIGHQTLGWKSGIVNTCWTDDATRFKTEVRSLTLLSDQAELPTAAENDQIQSWLSAAYSRERTGIEILGFKECIRDKPENALLIYNTDLHGIDPRTHASVAISGQASTGDFSSGATLVNRLRTLITRKPIASGVVFNQTEITATIKGIQDRMNGGLIHHLDPVGKMRADLPEILARYSKGIEADIRHWAVLHEFGHLTGLLHEEERKDTLKEQPSFCGKGPFDTLWEGDIDPNPDSRFGTDFDPFSIMNYCRKTMQILYRQAVLVCEIGGEDLKAGYTFVSGAVPNTLAPLIENCDFIKNTPFPVDLTPRDITGLRNLYLKEVPTPGPSTSYKKSETEKKWIEVFTLTDRLFL